MSDRTIQVGMLVVVIAILAVTLVSLAKLPTQASAPVATAVIGALVTVIGGLIALINRPSNNIPPASK